MSRRDHHGGPQGRPPMQVHEGDGMSADDAAWAEVADAADRALTLPDLSPSCAVRLEQMSQACRLLAGLPHPQPPRSDAHPLAPVLRRVEAER